MTRASGRPRPSDMKAAHLAQQAAINPDDLVETDDQWNENRDHCNATPAEHTARYRLESEWRTRQAGWAGL